MCYLPPSGTAQEEKRLRKSRVPGLRIISFIVNWVWPRDRCGQHHRASISSLSWHPDYLSSGSPSKSLARISRAADGRFVLVDSALSLRSDSPSNVSSSDDGGFLPSRKGRGIRNRASWRKPLVGYPSQLSLRSDASGQSARGLAGFFGFGNRTGQYTLKPIPTIYTPQTPNFQSSSPSTLLLSPWTPMYFSDLSSVRYTSSGGDRSYPTPPGFVQLKSVHERYSQELPSLRAIHEESQGFIPVHPIRDSPRVRIPQGPRPRARLLPRHARIARSAPELLSSPDHHPQDRSPESRSSSSGFGSKNTSSQQNQSSQSGSTFESSWRLLPPYRPPPPPPSIHAQLPPPPPLSVGHWLELASSSPSTSDQLHKAVDVGSVDGHYEFDPSTPTPTPSTPTGSRDVDLDAATTTTTTTAQQQRKGYTLRSRYDNIDARVQAMKEEFNEFRKRQAKRRRSHELESAC